MSNGYDEIKDVKMQRPHLIILGAGASRAAFPNGDKNGKKLPIMNDLIEVVGLQDELKSLSVDFENKNFEGISSELFNQGHPEILEKMESKIYKYFSSLELPDSTTLYDHIVLSLREKDIIATFNWDPFLFDACERNYHFAIPPKLFFLHGNVRIGYCIGHKQKGKIGSKCSICGNYYEKSNLLFPIENKNYNKNGYIKAEWDSMIHYMGKAYILTIFGYSAPKTDVEAIDLLKQGWGDVNKRNFEETEIIDIKEEDILVETWKEFIHTHHYQVYNNFYDSIVANHPRRSCEAIWATLMKNTWADKNPIPKDSNFIGLYS